MQVGGNRKRPPAPSAKGAGKQVHDNAGPFGPPMPYKQEGRTGYESANDGLMEECKGTGSDMSVRNTKT